MVLLKELILQESKEGSTVEQMDYCDKFALAIFDGEKGVDEALKGLSAVEEDDVLIRLVCGYMGVDVDKAGAIVEKQIGD